uniref:Myosin motor domain-containing protein n=1 Tax=Glossina morsitans morsitans TaxID=37546 RepID=A0A1A9YUH7_GLOMM
SSSGDHQDCFYYLNCGRSPEINKISDGEQFKETIQAMQVLSLDPRQILDIPKILGSILHLGNIKYANKYKKDKEELDFEGCDIYLDDLHLRVMRELLLVKADELRKRVLLRQIKSAHELVLPNDKETAVAERDALAKHIYAKLFQHIVTVANKGLNNDRKQSLFIGVLDIYGLKLEQEKYLKEGREMAAA